MNLNDLLLGKKPEDFTDEELTALIVTRRAGRAAIRSVKRRAAPAKTVEKAVSKMGDDELRSLEAKIQSILEKKRSLK